MDEQHFQRLLAEIAGGRRHTDEVAQALREEIAASGQTLREEIAASGRAVTRDVRQEIADCREELRRHFGVVGEGLRHDLRLVAEGVVACNERIDRLAEATAREFKETRGIVNLSWAELDRRLRRLEATAAG